MRPPNPELVAALNNCSIRRSLAEEVKVRMPEILVRIQNDSSRRALNQVSVAALLAISGEVRNTCAEYNDMILFDRIVSNATQRLSQLTAPSPVGLKIRNAISNLVLPF